MNVIISKGKDGKIMNLLSFENENDIIQKVVRLSKVSFAEIRQFAPGKTFETNRSEYTIDETSYLSLETIALYRKIFRWFVIASLANFDVRTERENECNHQTTTWC